jgi:putative toxin-antitoxin system antitoxin component (TIGR02293 family)
MAVAFARTGSEVAEILGGTRVLGVRVGDDRDLQRELRKGLPFKAFEGLANSLDMPARDLAGIVGLSLRTLARRKTTRRFSPIESDRIYRVARIALLASQTFGSLAQGREWLRRPNRALGGEPPISLLDTSVGERNVEETLLRISYGIYS